MDLQEIVLASNEANFEIIDVLFNLVTSYY